MFPQNTLPDNNLILFVFSESNFHFIFEGCSLFLYNRNTSLKKKETPGGGQRPPPSKNASCPTGTVAFFVELGLCGLIHE